MSCYNWERGTITLPTKEWANFRKSLLTAWNAHQDSVLAKAKTAYAAAVAAGKGKRGDNRTKAMKVAVARACGGRISEWGDFESGHRGGHDSHDKARETYEAVHGLIWKYQGHGKPPKFQSPQKKDLPFAAVSKDATLNLDEATVTFNNKSRTVGWCVSENNRAVESANDHWFAKKLFAALGRITWTRGTGGKIIGNDEYNRDSDYEDGGGNYVTHDYHMKTTAEKKAEAARRNRNNYSSYGGGYGRSW